MGSAWESYQANAQAYDYARYKLEKVDPALHRRVSSLPEVERWNLLLKHVDPFKGVDLNGIRKELKE